MRFTACCGAIARAISKTNPKPWPWWIGWTTTTSPCGPWPLSCCSNLTGRTNSYRPLDTASHRRVSIQRWRTDVNEGKLFN